MALRHELGLYACLRPCKSYPGVRSRYDNVDLVVVRENTEDLYAGIEYEAGTADAARVIATLNGMQAKQITPDIGHLGQADQPGGVASGSSATRSPTRVHMAVGASRASPRRTS